MNALIPEIMATGNAIERIKGYLVEIERHKKATQDSFRAGIETIIKVGEELSNCKETMEHGQWLPWIDSNFGLTERTAQRYMNVYRNKDAAEQLICDERMNMGIIYEIASMDRRIANKAVNQISLSPDEKITISYVRKIKHKQSKKSKPHRFSYAGFPRQATSDTTAPVAVALVSETEPEPANTMYRLPITKELHAKMNALKKNPDEPLHEVISRAIAELERVTVF